MKLIYKLIIKQWVTMFIATFFILLIITAMGDFIDHMIKHDPTFTTITDNLYVKSTLFIAKLLPIACIMTSLFFLNKLKTHSELTAILASGFSKRKIANILLLGGVFTLAIQLLNTGFHEANVYEFNQSLDKSYARKFSKKPSTDSGTWFKNDTYYGNFIYFDSKTKTMIKPNIFFFKDGLIHKTIKADLAVIKEKNIWEFTNAQSRSLLSNQVNFPIYQKHELLIQKLKEDFSDFSKYQDGILSLSLFKLKSFINKLQQYNLNVREYLVLFYDKIATALSCLIFSIFPIFTLHNIGKRSSSAGRSIFFTLLFTLCFWFLAGSTQTIGAKVGAPPFISVFLIHIILCIFCTYHYFKLEKLV